MLEVDVDVGGLVALGADEAFEQQVDAVGVHRRYAQAVADGRVGRRAPALAQDPPAPGEADDVVHGQEVGREGQGADEFQFALDLFLDLVGDAAGVAPGRPGPGKTDQFLLGGAAVGDRIDGILVAQLVQAEGAAPGDLGRAGDGARIVAEQPRHLLGRLQVALGVGEQAEAGVMDGAVLADAGEHVLQGPAPGRVRMHVVGRHQGCAAVLGKPGEGGHPAGVVATIKIVRNEVEALLEVIF